MRQNLLVATLLSALLLAPHAVAAQFTVGVETTDYMPIYKGEGGQYSGYARELLDTFAAKYGHTLTYKPMPVTRLFDEFIKQKSVDFKFPDNPRWQPDLKKGVNITYSKGAVTVVEGMLVLPANKGRPLSALKTMATLRGFTPWPFIDAIKSGALRVNEANTADAALQLGLSGRADGVFLNTISADYLLNERLKQPSALVLDESLPVERSEFSLATLSHPEVISQFNEFLTREKSTIDRLKAKYKIPN